MEKLFYFTLIDHLHLQNVQKNFIFHFLAAIMLHMIANILTQDVFRNGLIKYLRAQLVCLLNILSFILIFILINNNAIRSNMQEESLKMQEN
jgi:hypothetical protein